MNFSYFNIDLLSSHAAEIEKAFPITFCDEKDVELQTGVGEVAASEITEMDIDKSATSSDGGKPKAKKAKWSRRRKTKQKVIEADFHYLATDALLAMKENDMLNVLYNHDINRLLQQPVVSFPSDTLKERFEKTCKKYSSPFITTAREAMWEEFNKIWTDANVTKQIKDTLCVTSDFCSWFLLYVQQAVSKRYLKHVPSTLVANVDLTDVEKESVAYIAGAALKNISSKLYKLKKNVTITGKDVSSVDIDIKLLDACKDSEEEMSDSTSTSTKLIEALNQGGLIFPKMSIINMFLEVEGIFRRSISPNSKLICEDFLLSESLDNESVQNNFLNATDNEIAENEQKFRILKMCLQFYIKVRCYAHAKYVIENYRVDTKTERKKKALRKKLQLSEQEK